MNAPTPMSRDKKRPRRIAQDEAHSWARNLRLRNPHAKLVISMLTLYVNGDGVCFVGIEALSEDTELSTDTVRKRLTWLEEIGAIARFPQWIDPHGRRNGEGRGKRTSDEIRLLIDSDMEAIEARAAGEEVIESEPETSTVSPCHQQGLNPDAETASPPAGPGLALCQPSDSGKGLSTNLNTEPEPEDSPPSVPRTHGGEVGEDSNEGEDQPTGDVLEGWQEFKREFEADGDVIVKSSLPMTLFQALNPQQRALLIKAARGLIWVRKKQKSTRPKPAPQTFIRETDSWDNWASQAPPREQDFHIIEADCGEAEAYRNLRRAGGAVAPSDSARYMLKRPLTTAEMAFEKLPPRRAWRFADNPKQVASWLEFYAHALAGMALRQLVETRTLDGEQHRGLETPWQWPPTKDGRTIPWPVEEQRSTTPPPPPP